MIFEATPLAGSYVITPKPFTDDRGWFFRYYCKEEFKEIGHTKDWVQCNHSFTAKKGTLRGMHFQIKPFREVKMARCIAGAVYDVIIDIRQESSTFLQWFGIELSARNKKTVYIPEGFAHGFQCLTDNCEMLYHHSEYYKPGYEGTIRYDDPRVNIRWSTLITNLSPKDAEYPYLDKNFKGI